jgi:hypothetical protein
MTRASTKAYTFFIVLFIFFGCNFIKKSTTSNSEKLIGSWIDNSSAKLHFTLYENGKAKSDNMKTLIYKSWTTRNDSLFITVESIGNKIRFESIESYKIDVINVNELILQNKNFKMSCSRQK